jgi:hypothetical protein
MIVYYVPAKQTAFVMADTALTQAVFLIMLMTAAAVTRNLPGFALLCGSAIGALAIALSAAVAILMSRDDFATSTNAVLSLSTSAPMPHDEDPTGAFVWNVLVPLIGVAVLAVQYWSRSRLRSIVLAVAGVCLASAIADAWPWPVLAPRVLVPEWARAASALRLSADPATVDSYREEQVFARRAPWRLIRAGVHLDGIEPGWSATVALMNASIQMNDRSLLPTARAGFPAAVPVDPGDPGDPANNDEQHPLRRVIRDLLGVRRVAEWVSPKGESAVVFVVRDADSRESRPATGAYRGRFQVALTHHEIEATLPLRPGVSHQDGAYRFVLDGVERTRGGLTLFARESRALSRFDRRPTALFGFYLRNRAEVRGGAPGVINAALAGQELDVREVPFLSRFTPFWVGYSVQTSGFIARGLMIRFSPTSGIQGESLPIDDAWFGGAELVIVRTTREGSVQRQLDIPDFPLRTDPSS